MPDSSVLSQEQLMRFRRVSIILASLAFTIGVAALIGWIFDIEVLKRVHPSLVTMKANTAVCFMLAAVSVFLVTDSSGPKINRWIAFLLAGLVAIVGLITLSEHVFGWSF